jgi:[ribosomal protein S18]-alanine N-acetyltransferase
MSLPDHFTGRLGELELVGEPYTAEHVPDLLVLEQACFPAPWSEGLLRQEAESRQHAWNLVLRVNGVVKAFFFNWIVLDEMHLLNFAVSPELQGKGLGGWLLDWMLKQAAAARYHSVNLEVRASNLKALALYESRGFRQTSLRLGYYTDNREDAVIMALELDCKERDDALQDS